MSKETVGHTWYSTESSPLYDESLFESDCQEVTQSVWTSPEKRLLLTMFLDGVRKALNGVTTEQRWVLSQDRSRLCTFENLAESLGFDPVRCRRVLAARWQLGLKARRQMGHIAGSRTGGRRYR